ncbi:MAG: RtcB family protein [Kiritimatiellia bacterium]|jgi:tRNA-splicing ligase RtcB
MKWTKFGEGWKIPVKSWCDDVDALAMKQAANLARHPVIERHVALMPDCHAGMGMPIGGVIACANAVIPSAVGVDIGCGMVAVETDVPAAAFEDRSRRRKLLERLKMRIPVGEGVSHGSPQSWEGFETYLARLPPSEQEPPWPSTLDRCNLGTLGGGNHFVEIQKSGDGFIWLMVHSGSRNLGYRVEQMYMRLAQRHNAKAKIDLPDPDLAFLPLDSEDGRDYLRDMKFSLDYAQENRRLMMAAFKDVVREFEPDAGFLREINIHHNYAAVERHFGREYVVHRKGATSAKQGEPGIIPGSMGTASYIVRGLGNPESFESCSHGAGRVMSRTEAVRTLSEDECNRALKDVVFDRWKQWGKYKKTRGMLDLSEAPQCYKPIDEVIADQADLVEPLVRLVPLAVLKG